jgi:hypothetical protein
MKRRLVNMDVLYFIIHPIVSRGVYSTAATVVWDTQMRPLMEDITRACVILV